jgi:GTPase SAR1 family protein
MDANQISQLKNELIELMDGMCSYAKKYPKLELPAVPKSFTLSEELLKSGEFNLAVCGKVKNGKSSLINALIGRDLLPVCNDVATSRVFKISNAEKDSFYLVYSNGDREEISFEELKMYGSQATIDSTGEIPVEKSIAYIQVNTKIDFLPDGVSLLDTPGIGSTYPQHTAITKQNIKMADAAIFVLNPTSMEKCEIDFLKEVAAVTPGIVFVTTKVDLSSPKSVEEAVKRNREQIEKAVGKDLCFGINMECMSSNLLMAASNSEDNDQAEFNYKISGYEEVKASISRIVFLTLGVYRSAQAYNNATSYYQSILKILQNRKEAVKQSMSNYAALLAKYDDANKDFTSKMGDSKKSAVSSKIEVILKTMENDFNDIFSMKGKICTDFTNKINDLSQEEIAVYSETLGEEIVARAQESWNRFTALVQQRCAEVLTEYNNECMMSVPNDIKVSVDEDEVADPSISDVELREKVGKMRTEMFMGTAITSGISTIVGGAYYFLPTVVTPALPVIAPVLVVLGVGAVLWGAIVGNKKAKQERLQKNKTQLIKYLQDTLQSCRKQMVETSLANGKYQSLYQGFLIAVRNQALQSINTIYDKYKTELDAMKKTVVSSKQDPELLKALDFVVNDWSKKKTALTKIYASLDNLKK